MKLSFLARLLLFLLSFHHLGFFPVSCNGSQSDNLNKLIHSWTSRNIFQPELWNLLDEASVYTGRHAGLMEADKIGALPGQPAGVDFDQYAGYVTVDPIAGRKLFYYFVEAPQNSTTKPLVLWLNGGPGCSSLGYGAMEELGPFRVNSGGKTLHRNKYAWNNVANVIFLESPAGVGFSYSKNSYEYNAGDKSTAKDSYTFLVNWLQRFPQYKNRQLFIAGENYAGHYVPQLAHTIVSKNNRNQTRINLKGIAIGNPWIDDITGRRGRYEYYWSHALNSDKTIAGIRENCDFDSGWSSPMCNMYQRLGTAEIGLIDSYNDIYAPSCSLSPPNSPQTASVNGFDPCSDHYVAAYLNLPEVQRALHAKPTKWAFCSGYAWGDTPLSVLPTIRQLISSGIRTWIYSGDTDALVPVTSTRFAINELNLTVTTNWNAWYSGTEIGGYVEVYNGGLTFITIRGAGHSVPSYQPERALTMISSFLQGKLPNNVIRK